MSLRLVALDEGSDIPIDREMIMMGRHSTCDARLESIRVSRHHCCMLNRQGILEVRDLNSTNGIRINGRKVDVGMLRLGDELTVAHIRFRLEDRGLSDENTAFGTLSDVTGDGFRRPMAVDPARSAILRLDAPEGDSPLAAAVRGALPRELAGCKIQVIVQVADNPDAPSPPDGIRAEESKDPS